MNRRLSKTVEFCCKHDMEKCIPYVRSRMTFTNTWRQLGLSPASFPYIQKLTVTDKAALMHAIASGCYAPNDNVVRERIQRNREIGRRLGLTPKEEGDSGSQLP